MTTPAIDTSSIEHLDQQPECSQCKKVAQNWIDQHKCMDYFLCDRCLEWHHRMSATCMSVMCNSCRVDFLSFDAMATVVPL